MLSQLCYHFFLVHLYLIKEKKFSAAFILLFSFFLPLSQYFMILKEDVFCEAWHCIVFLISFPFFSFLFFSLFFFLPINVRGFVAWCNSKSSTGPFYLCLACSVSVNVKKMHQSLSFFL